MPRKKSPIQNNAHNKTSLQPFITNICPYFTKASDTNICKLFATEKHYICNKFKLMRLLTLLLSLYILLITLVPCHCDDDCVAENKAEHHNHISQTIKADTHQEDADKCQDRCTPFCCCANQHVVCIVFCMVTKFICHNNIQPDQAVKNSIYMVHIYSTTLTSQKLPPEA